MKGKIQMKICLGSSCFARGNKDVLSLAKAFLVQYNLTDKVDFRGSHCLNKCQHGPNLKIDDKLIQQIDANNIEQVLRKNLLEQ